jgi:hypothetical protein
MKRHNSSLPTKLDQRKGHLDFVESRTRLPARFVWQLGRAAAQSMLMYSMQKDEIYESQPLGSGVHAN